MGVGGDGGGGGGGVMGVREGGGREGVEERLCLDE